MSVYATEYPISVFCVLIVSQMSDVDGFFWETFKETVLVFEFIASL